MSVEEIPSDTLVEMTPELYQEFAQGGCVPACHLSEKWINIGDKFRLATLPCAYHPSGGTAGLIRIEERDVMLSESADEKKFVKIQYKILSDWEKGRKEAIKKGRGGCFRINGKIVH
ncbi:hypothetical protein [Pedobacter metabolipauper]|uniref:Uncharacterized protein n=1 Tax=Pedobacter metabolipauper TaxID=425513 RepID=A0A4R6T165_9SPHI|nr:hypothetical protein [Pedobacter metabolipauper]TDQ12192.1 hypothetical protein ATK78_1326 [Pedobacter metabolipauper]